MGKLHKIRHQYKKLTAEEKDSLVRYFTTGMQVNGKAFENVLKFSSFGGKNQYHKPYRYYIESLVKKDGLLKKNDKWSRRVSQLVQHKGNTTRFNAYI